MTDQRPPDQAGPEQRRAGSSDTGARPDRSEAERVADHASIDRLAGVLLPALVARLSATGLGELEVREGDWRVRLRRPADPDEPRGDAPRWSGPERRGRAQPGHAGHGHAPAAIESHRSASEPHRSTREARGPVAPSVNGSQPPLVAVGPGAGGPAARSDGGGRERRRTIATSPAVGVYRPRAELVPGSQVHVGDRIAAVDVLGIPQEVLAPVDGILGATIVEAGQAVEYGQELVFIELAAAGED